METLSTTSHVGRRPDVPSAELAVDAPSQLLFSLNWIELIALLVTFGCYLAAVAVEGAFRDFMNLAGPTILIAALAWGGATMLRHGIVSVWTPLFWIRISFIAFCGVGSLVPYIVNDQTISYISAFFNFFPADVAKYNLVCSLFVITMLIGSQLASAFASQARKPFNRKSDSFIEPSALSLKLIGVVLFSVGSLGSYLLILPYELGFISGSLPQFAVQLSLLLQVAFFLLTFALLREGSRWVIIIVSIAIIDSMLGVITFDKSSALFPLIMVALGCLYHRPTFIRFLASAVILISVYVAITPIATHGRNVLVATYGEVGASPISERIAIIQDYRSGSRIGGVEELDLGWTRLSYVNAGTFAINQYDTGQRGNSLDNWLVVFIPRFLYPDKPIITAIGEEFNEAATGSPDSSSSPGLAADLYWSAGFAGVIVGGLFVGIILHLWSLYSVAVMRAGAWHLLVIVLLGMRVGQGADDFFVPSMLGPLTFAIVGHLALSLLNRLAFRRRPTLGRA